MKHWLTNEISNLEYLLLLNILSSRSYDDINQFPVLKEKFIWQAQRSSFTIILSIINLCFSSSLFSKNNQYTNNQIDLQVNIFDNPKRQFMI